MKAHAIAVGCMLIAAATLPLAAQQPQLGSIEAPYPRIQTTVHVAGGTYGPGAVAYGQVGAPLVLTGSNLGTSGTVQFLGYMNGSPDGKNATPTVTLWTPTLLILSVPSRAVTGLVEVTTSGGTSNPGLPFIVTPGSYSPSCPVAPDDSDFQIVTSSLQDGTVGQSYSVTLSATGGLPPYTWSNEGNALPSGLSLSSAGVVSGTPSAATTNPVSLTIQAQDSNHLLTQALFNLTVDSSLKTTGTVYSYCVPGPNNPACTLSTSGFDSVGNVAGYQDSVMGNWTFQYDTLNRLATGNATSGDYDGQYACWNYDSFGNRQQQVLSSVAFQSGSGGANACQPPSTAYISTDLAAYNSQNQITGTNAPGVTAAPGYDAAGNIASDGVRSYLYDAEGRICAVAYTPVVGSTSYYGYQYDAEGNRVAKGTITTWSCDPAASGLTYTESYVLSPDGQQLTMLDGNGQWQRTNVYAGSLIATYDTTSLHFHLSDPVGTRRVQTSATGNAETDCESLPFGDEMTCFPTPNAPNTADDSTPLHFTGKERDTETGGLDGNDYFGARYYSSAMGRFMSPDWSDDPDPVPYADFDDPQSLNLYGFAHNNPLSYVDDDGHLPCGGTANITIIVTPNGSSMSQSPDDCPYRTPNLFDEEFHDSLINTLQRTHQFMSGVNKGVSNALSSFGNMMGGPQGYHYPAQPLNGSDEERGALAGNIALLFMPGPDEIEGLQFLSRDQILAEVTNPALRTAIKEIYRAGASIGDGSTAAAIEHELETGEMVGGKWHSIKGRDSINRLRRILREQNLSPRERAIAQAIIRRTAKALGIGGPA